ncbi:MAG: hypothetical protein PUF60_00945 [Firmicutes bacterium]|nr:hypothetical protein [Bacillota bacterium]
MQRAKLRSVLECNNERKIFFAARGEAATYNKRELYIFLWERCAQITIDYLTEYGCYEKMKAFKAENTLKSLDPGQFREGIDLKMMYREMYLASEGYLWEMVQREDVDVDRMEKDFTGMIEFWKKAYTKEGGSE